MMWKDTAMTFEVARMGGKRALKNKLKEIKPFYSFHNPNNQTRNVVMPKSKMKNAIAKKVAHIVFHLIAPQS